MGSCFGLVFGDCGCGLTEWAFEVLGFDCVLVLLIRELLLDFGSVNDG